jgi:hypothetical protein
MNMSINEAGNECAALQVHLIMLDAQRQRRKLRTDA